MIPGGANIFYLDFAPGAQNPMVRFTFLSCLLSFLRTYIRKNNNSPLLRPALLGDLIVDDGEQTQHRTSSTDYVVVIKGTLTVLAPPPEPFDVTDDGKGSYAEMAETVAREGDIVVQRGSMHT